MKTLFYTIFIVFLLASCSRDDENLEPEPAEEDVWSVNRENQYALNIVFFKPSDFIADGVLLKQISDVMIFIQKWYEKQMDLQGFDKKTFGLVTNQHGEVKIHVIEGPKLSTYYLDNQGDVKNEVDQYFINNPEESQSAHTFVLGSAKSGVPFYGLGRMAFATSKDYTLRSSGKFIDDLDLKNCDVLGGIIHELGHGLNLPHSAHKGSDLPKISLMSFGNHTYQEGNTDLVFLTKSDCAILDVSETFNTKDKQYYDVEPEITLGAYTVTKDDANKVTTVNGVLTSSVKAAHFYVGHNGYPLEGGYDNITFTVPLTPTANAQEYSFNLQMSYSDIFNGYQLKDSLELSMVVITENGFKKVINKYDYTINVSTQIPNDNIEKDYTPFVFSDRTNWVITANTEGPNRGDEYMIDGLYSTFWHSAWNYNIAVSGNHEIVIDMAESKTINGIFLHSFRDHPVQYRPKHASIQTSNDNITWTTIIDEVVTTTMGNAKEVRLNFTNPVNTRYIKLIIDQVHSGDTSENLVFSEVDIM